MLEDAIKENTAELVKLRQAIEKSGGAAPAAGKAADKPAAAAKPAAAKKPKYSADQVKAKIVEVKDTISQERAAQVISDAGHADDKLAGLLATPGHFDKAYELAEAALLEVADDETAEEDEL